MTAAVPEPTLEGKIAEAYHRGIHEGRACPWMPEADCPVHREGQHYAPYMAAVLAPLVVEVRERAAVETLEAAAVRIEGIEPTFINRGPQRMYAFEQAKTLAARTVRAGGRP